MKKIISVFLVFLFALCMPFAAYADNELQLIQARMSEDNIDIFLSNDLDYQSISVKVANSKADIIDCGAIDEVQILTRTTILVDISNSVPSASRDNVTKLLEYQVENITKNEEMRILSFGKEVNILQEFTSDRYDLYKAVEQIVYNGTQSAVYDAIYNTMPEMASADDETPCFYRTIVITDGADYTTQGITKEELLMKLQSTTYPIDVICVNKAKPQNSNKDLSALTRISNGRYFDIHPDSDIKQLFSDLSVKDYYWIRASVPYKYLDGSIRQVDVQDNMNRISFDIKMSVADYEVTEEPDIQAVITTEVTEKTESTSAVVSSTQISQNDDSGNADFTLLLLIIGAVVVLAVIITIVVAVIYSRPKKKKTDDMVVRNVSGTTDVTELYEENTDDGLYEIKISDAFNTNLCWTLEVPGEIIIGRADNCDITLTDKSVSHEQCKIAVREKGLMVQNLSRSNHTKLNGHNVDEETLLHPTDTLHFGRVTLIVDSIQKIGFDEKMTDSDKDDEDRETDMIFDRSSL